MIKYQQKEYSRERISNYFKKLAKDKEKQRNLLLNSEIRSTDEDLEKKLLKIAKDKRIIVSQARPGYVNKEKESRTLGKKDIKNDLKAYEEILSLDPKIKNILLDKKDLEKIEKQHKELKECTGYIIYPYRDNYALAHEMGHVKNQNSERPIIKGLSNYRENKHKSVLTSIGELPFPIKGEWLLVS